MQYAQALAMQCRVQYINKFSEIHGCVHRVLKENMDSSEAEMGLCAWSRQIQT
jgi:hypothetical protein